MEELHVILAGFDPARRSRLREMLREARFSCEVEQRNSVADVLGALELGAGVDIVIVPAGPRREDVLDFLIKLQSYPALSRPLVVLALRGKDHDSVLVSEFYVAGANGFLSEPFSPETLEEVLETAQGCKAQSESNLEAKTAQVAMFLLSNSMRLLDEMARQRKSGLRAKGHAGRKLDQVGRAFSQSVERVGMDKLLEQVIEKFQTAAPFDPPSGSAGAPRRLKPVAHPGAHIKALLKKRGISRERAFDLLHVRIPEFEAVMEGNADLGDDLAAELARVFGGVPEYWTRLQQSYTQYKEALLAQSGGELK